MNFKFWKDIKMKKGILLLFLLVFGVHLYGQVEDSIPHSGFSFPIGTKVTIQLVPVDSVNFNYRVVKFEAYRDTINLDNDEKLLSDSIDNDKIEFVFSYAMYKNDKDNKLLIVLELRSGLKSILDYKADIQVPNRDFESTSVVPLIPKAKMREDWRNQIDAIALHSFRKYEKNGNKTSSPDKRKK